MSEVPGGHGLSNKQRRKRDDRTWRRALVVSVLLHLLIFLWRSDVPFVSGDGLGSESDDDAASGGAVRSLVIALPQPEPIPRPAIPIPVEVEIEPPDLEQQASIDIEGMLGELKGPETGPGQAQGSGGDGGGGGGGRSTLIPASPRGMIIPPSHNSLRGKEVRVWVFVTEAGRVLADSTYLEPPTGDGDLNDLLLREAADWTFNPARRGGEAVSAWFPYVISVGG